MPICQEAAQANFKKLLDALIATFHHKLFYDTQDINGLGEACEPLESYFIRRVRTQRASFTLMNDAFLKKVFRQVVKTDCPIKRNHLLYQVEWHNIEPEQWGTYKCYIDLDLLAALLNNYYKNNPPYQYTLPYHTETSNPHGKTGNLWYTQTKRVNSVESFQLFMLIGDFLSLLSGIALLLAALGLLSMIALSTTQILLLGGSGAVGAMSYWCFFQSPTLKMDVNISVELEENMVDSPKMTEIDGAEIDIEIQLEIQ